jgi:hypothetical protein
LQALARLDRGRFWFAEIASVLIGFAGYNNGVNRLIGRRPAGRVSTEPMDHDIMGGTTGVSAMRQTAITILWGICLVLLIPPIWDRFMSSAPGWAWQALAFAFVILTIAVVLMLDPIWSRLTAPRQFWIASTVIVGLAAGAVVGSAWWIFVAGKPSGKLDLVAIVSVAEYPSGTRIVGIPWRNPYAEIQLTIGNPTPDDYENLRLMLKADQPIAGIGLQTIMPNVTLGIPSLSSFRPEVARPDGTRVVLPMEVIGNSLGYEIQCPVLKSKSAMRIVLATVSGFRMNRAPDGTYENPSFWLRLRLQNADEAIWFGYANRPDDIYAPKSEPKSVKIEGTFEVEKFKLAVSETVLTQDVYGDLMRKYLPQTHK